MSKKKGGLVPGNTGGNDKSKFVMIDEVTTFQPNMVQSFLIASGINHLKFRAHDDAKSLGWYEKGKVKTNLESLAMIHTEVSEAIEELRKGQLHLYKVPDAGDPNKPEGLVVELADVMIRCADLAEHLGLDLGNAIVQKLNYNLTRGKRHGNKPF